MKSQFPKLPDWLAPYKNKWLTTTELCGIIEFEGKDFRRWLGSERDRIKHTKTACKNGMGYVRRFLVKHLWAVSKADGITMAPTLYCAPQDNLILEVERLRRETEKLKKNPLVQTVEKVIDRTPHTQRLLRLLVTATEARPQPGVYFLLDGNEAIIYVGQSRNVLARMAGHQDKQYAHVRMVRVDDDKERLYVEAVLTSIFAPALNKTNIGRVYV